MERSKIRPDEGTWFYGLVVFAVVTLLLLEWVVPGNLGLLYAVVHGLAFTWLWIWSYNRLDRHYAPQLEQHYQLRSFLAPFTLAYYANLRRKAV